ncbi:hypothetical protein C491_15132 [Natronococcus amylolyticus DSM 10524]|uniref:Uncharacterized protein n=1 Tax=Natronococcus amylolyticus DSM 10524 TaxID=1227497 RepID=L9X3U7_9EURY|nr:hypothetical protein C491_15132 [Natronococcus amylolyticus DSM 10524]
MSLLKEGTSISQPLDITDNRISFVVIGEVRQVLVELEVSFIADSDVVTEADSFESGGFGE